MTARTRAMAEVVCFVPDRSTSAEIVAELSEGQFQVKVCHDLQLFLEAMKVSTDLVALVIDEAVADEATVAQVSNSLSCSFKENGGPVVLLSSAARTQSLRDLQASLNACRIVNPGHGSSALHGAIAVEVEEFRLRQSVRAAVEAGTHDIGDLSQASYRFRTREEAKNLATLFASACQERVAVAIGLTELFVNAVEHGCLNIGHGEKGRLIEKGRLADEIKYRRSLPEYADRYATVEFTRTEKQVKFHVVDPGEGFDHKSFVNSKQGHAKKHGRGITMAGGCFDELTYLGKGNEVIAVHHL
ncbi:MAG: ATP-binding protein [Alphaproteobacteria bacterium]|nr:ATP-binding protein [Alphaproteobacteria bacterium]